MTRAREVPAALLIATLALTGCGPSQEEIITSSDNVHAQTFALAEQGVSIVRDLNPDLDFDLRYVARRDDRWSNCGESPRSDTEPPKAIQWIDNRMLNTAPPRETVSLIDAVVAAFVADGWTAGNDSINRTATGDGRGVYLRKSGYTIALDGQTGMTIEDYAYSLNIHVYSPCIIAPDDILDWKPGDIPPMPTPPPGATVPDPPL